MSSTPIIDVEVDVESITKRLKEASIYIEEDRLLLDEFSSLEKTLGKCYKKLWKFEERHDEVLAEHERLNDAIEWVEVALEGVKAKLLQKYGKYI